MTDVLVLMTLLASLLALGGLVAVCERVR